MQLAIKRILSDDILNHRCKRSSTIRIWCNILDFYGLKKFKNTQFLKIVSFPYNLHSKWLFPIKNLNSSEYLLGNLLGRKGLSYPSEKFSMLVMIIFMNPYVCLPKMGIIGLLFNFN